MKKSKQEISHLFTKKNKVSVWASNHPYKEIPDEYFEETFFKKGLRAKNTWSDNFKMRYFKPEDLETNGSHDDLIDIKQAVGECSFSCSFIEQLMSKARKKNLLQVSWVVLLFEYEYSMKVSGIEKDEYLTLVGAFDYDDDAESLFEESKQNEANGEVSSNLKSIEWLSQNLEDPKLVILDATMMKQPNGKPVPQPEVNIPGAKRFNFDTEICDQSTELPHMMPSQTEFEKSVQELGINNDSIIVIYDAMGIFSSPRAWWMFKTMGFDKVFVLDGGLPKWKAAELALESEYQSKSVVGNFIAKFNKQRVVSNLQVLASIEDERIQIIDARSLGRFNATEPEPRPDLLGGHIPTATCLPFTDVREDGFMKDHDDLVDLFESTIKDSTESIIFSCGSGVTACILALAASEVGVEDYSVYDGSWTEWALSESMPKNS